MDERPDRSLPSISIIVATFNNEGTLQQCLDSITRQTYPHKELIVIDGGSSDGTVRLLEANDYKISSWVSEPDRGIYHAWNKALSRASGEWICFLGADDHLWDEHVLTRMAGALANLPPDIRVVYGQIMLLNKLGERLYAIGEPWARLKQQFLKSMCIPHPGMMHHRSLFELHGPFDESFRIAGDYEMLLRELTHTDAQFVPSLIIAGVQQGGISSRPDAALMVLSEARRAQRMHGQRRPSLPWLWAVCKVYLRLLLWRLLGERVTRSALDLGRQMLNQPKHWTKT